MVLTLGLALTAKALSSEHAPSPASAFSPYDYSFMAKGADPNLHAFQRGSVINEDEMSDLRGGFNIAGMQMNFGAKISTLINDRINYETVLNFSDMGTKIVSQNLNDTMQEKFAAMNQTMQDNMRRMQTPKANGVETSDKSASFTNGGATLVSAGKAQAQVAKISQGKIDVSGLADFSGVVVNGAKGGTTAALHSITREAIVTALANTASGQTISQSIDIKIDIRNFSELKSAMQRANIMRSLSDF